MSSRRRAGLRSLALVAAAALALSGCTSKSDHPGKASAGESPTATPTTPAPETTVGDPTPTSTPNPGLTNLQLLGADQVPGLNSKWRWSAGQTGPADAKPFGVCARTDLANIGAVQAIQSSYFPPDDSDDNAAQQIADFVDAKSTAQAWAVLEAWRVRCTTTLGSKVGPKVSASIPVPIAGGGAVARWYLVSWTPTGEETGRFEVLGMIRAGNRISVLRMTNSGQDYDYPVGKEPMFTMIKRAAPLVTAGTGQ